ncbi:hypothetical protein MANES_09G071400v8 [Manihot esculenta]|uniref:Uncharacterized protein n=1 Tax=Manihot esculenta TaxID=3983 RepID=A0ACB7H3Q8_MANES|nr:hypothetical protein MANES_09G071400v8 [Manihot esculenta]
MVKTCWRTRIDDDASGKAEGLMWHKDLGNHLYGEFSMAVIQANNLLEDHCQLESGPLSSSNSGPYGTFIGVYDGHAGTEASRFISHNLFSNFKALVSEHHEISENVINKAFSATEEDFLCLVKKQWLSRPQIASVGSCCLVGVVCNGQLYIANAGDSRVALGRAEPGIRRVKAIQLSREHNANIESVRNELRSLHPDDSQIVVLKHKVWRVKGIIQVSRSIGDAYLKRTEFNREPLQSKYRLAEPFHKLILGSEPSILVHKLQPEDQFLIFASDGLCISATKKLSKLCKISLAMESPRDSLKQHSR